MQRLPTQFYRRADLRYQLLRVAVAPIRNIGKAYHLGLQLYLWRLQAVPLQVVHVRVCCCSK
jgi:hypothetical protein